MRADIQRLQDLQERFEQERLKSNPAPVKKMLITTDRKRARVWCEPCGYGFLTFASWQEHNKHEHIAKRA